MNYDAIVIGGGITGAGVLRDLALRGLKALLVEKDLPGRATTGASSHLIHGGVRYLLYDRPTTETTAWDSGHIVRIARPLLTRLPIVWPVYADHARGRTTIETLLESYDRFQPLKGGLPHLRLNAEETARLVPQLKRPGLRGGLVFDEWWVDPVRLVEKNLDNARANGAEVREKTAVTGLVLAGGAVKGVEVLTPRGERETLRADLVINAAGPWVDKVARLAGLSIPLRLQQGTHLVYDGNEAILRSPAGRFGLLLEAEDRERYVFVIPGGDMTLVGPTDITSPDDPDHLSPQPAETAQLLGTLRRYFDSFPERCSKTIVAARPILGQTGNAKLLSREFQVLDHAARGERSGLQTFAGGKMSDFRLMGEETGNAAVRLLKKGGSGRTHSIALDGSSVSTEGSADRPTHPLTPFLRRHPRLRELHALAHLGVGLAGHLARRLGGKTRDDTVDDFTRRYNAPASGL